MYDHGRCPAPQPSSRLVGGAPRRRSLGEGGSPTRPSARSGRPEPVAGRETVPFLAALRRERVACASMSERQGTRAPPATCHLASRDVDIPPTTNAASIYEQACQAGSRIVCGMTQASIRHRPEGARHCPSSGPTSSQDDGVGCAMRKCGVRPVFFRICAKPEVDLLSIPPRRSAPRVRGIVCSDPFGGCATAQAVRGSTSPMALGSGLRLDFVGGRS